MKKEKNKIKDVYNESDFRFKGVQSMIIRNSSILLTIPIILLSIYLSITMNSRVKNVSSDVISSYIDIVNDSIFNSINSDIGVLDTVLKSDVLSDKEVSMEEKLFYLRSGGDVMLDSVFIDKISFFDLQGNGFDVSDNSPSKVNSQISFDKSKLGTLSVSDVYSDLDKFYIDIYYPVSLNGELTNIISARLNTSLILDSITDINENTFDNIYLLNSSGDIVMSKDDSDFGTNVSSKPGYSSIYNNLSTRDGEILLSNGIASIPLGFSDLYLTIHLSDSYTEHTSSTLINPSLKGLLLLYIVTLICSYIIGKYISRPIRKLSSGLSQLSQLDLTVDYGVYVNKYVNYKDELGFCSRGILNTVNSIKDLISKVTNSVIFIDNTSKDLDKSNQSTMSSLLQIGEAVDNIAIGATSLAHDADNVSNAMSIISSLIDSGINSLNKLVSSLDNENKVMIEGHRVVDSLFVSNKDTSKSMIDINSSMDYLKESLSSISTFVKVIEQISNQTNLLALNATIEASKAGDSGRSFSVIAGEIRKLSEETMVKSKEISRAISIILNSIVHVDNSLNSLKDNVESQSSSVTDTIKRFDLLADSIENSVKEVHVLEGIFENVSVEKDNVLSSVDSLACVSEENAAITEEVSATVQEQLSLVTEVSALSESLVEDTKSIIEYMSKFKVNKEN